MNPFRELLDLVRRGDRRLQAGGELPAGTRSDRVAVEPPRDPSHGEAATNAAMVLAKAAGQAADGAGWPTRGRLDGARRTSPRVGSAAPGFINLTLAAGLLAAAGADRACGRRRLRPQRPGPRTQVNVEFCSANPTGPLHVGHGRGTVFGDALASVLEHAGYAVTREYYVNDGGAQIETLARSLHLRYREALGEAIGEIPAGPLSWRLSDPGGAAIAERDGEPLAHGGEAHGSSRSSAWGVEAMMRADPRRSRHPGREPRRVHFRARPDRRRPHRRGAGAPGRHGPASTPARCRRPRAASRSTTGSRCRSSCSARRPMATRSTGR